MLTAPAFIPEPTRTAGLKGIARLAAESPLAERRNAVDYRWLPCRTVINRVNGSRVDFEWSINPYRGCEFGCVYCYARYTHEFMEHRDPFDFERIIYLKRDLAVRLRAELTAGKCSPEQTLVLGAATDPYQPAERRFGLTRSALAALAETSGLKVRIITKSDLILRDLDLLRRLRRRHDLKINVTVTTVDAGLARLIEPRAVTPKRRIDAVAQLSRAGLTAGVFLMPIMPGINDAEDAVEAVAAAAARAGAAFLSAQVLFLASATKKRFLAFLAEKMPHLVPVYRRYYDQSPDSPPDYRRRMRQIVQDLRRRHGLLHLPDCAAAAPPASLGSAQLDLMAICGPRDDGGE